MYKPIINENRWYFLKELFANEEYDQCLQESENYYAELKINPDEFYMWKVSFEIALCLKKIGRIRRAMNCAKASLKYAITASDKTQVFWMLGCCYHNIDKQQSIKYYERAALNYERLGLTDYAYALRFNIAKILNDVDGMIDNLNKIDSKKNGTMKNQGSIELFNIYIAKNMLSKAIQLINKVNDKKTKDIMLTTIQQLNILTVRVG